MKRTRRSERFCVVIALIIGLSTNALTAKDRRGSTVRVTLKSGAQAQGELVAVRQDSLLILDGSGKEISFVIGEVLSLRVTGRKKKFPTGFVVFAASAVIGYAAGANPRIGPHDDDIRILSGVGTGLLFGAMGAIAGGIIEREASRGATSYILLEGMTEEQIQATLVRLRPMARNPD